LEGGEKVVQIDNRPGVPHHPTPLVLSLGVEWPYRSIWHGVCPTSQIYDFWVQRSGKTLWQWSNGHVFAQHVTPVSISGGAWHEFRETWNIDPASISESGRYTARARFIASGQEAVCDFDITLLE